MDGLYNNNEIRINVRFLFRLYNGWIFRNSNQSGLFCYTLPSLLLILPPFFNISRFGTIHVD